MHAPLALAASLTVLACVPGPFRLEAVEGRVVDGDSGEPIAGAEVFQWYRGAGRGGPPPVYHSRWTGTDADGRFAFPNAVSPLRIWLLRTYGPTYSFYHPRYGLEHGGEKPASGDLVLRGSEAVREQRMQNLGPFCLGERDDPAARHLAEIACPRRDRTR